MKNKNLILFLAAGAAYWYFFMYKKKQTKQIEQPNLPDQPGTNLPVQIQLTEQSSQVFVPSESSQNVFNENVSFAEQIKEFSAPSRESQIDIDGYQNYYVKQINGMKRMGVPYTI